MSQITENATSTKSIKQEQKEGLQDFGTSSTSSLQDVMDQTSNAKEVASETGMGPSEQMSLPLWSQMLLKSEGIASKKRQRRDQVGQERAPNERHQSSTASGFSLHESNSEIVRTRSTEEAHQVARKTVNEDADGEVFGFFSIPNVSYLPECGACHRISIAHQSTSDSDHVDVGKTDRGQTNTTRSSRGIVITNLEETDSMIKIRVCRKHSPAEGSQSVLENRGETVEEPTTKNEFSISNIEENAERIIINVRKKRGSSDKPMASMVRLKEEDVESPQEARSNVQLATKQRKKRWRYLVSVGVLLAAPLLWWASSTIKETANKKHERTQENPSYFVSDGFSRHHVPSVSPSMHALPYEDVPSVSPSMRALPYKYVSSVSPSEQIWCDGYQGYFELDLFTDEFGRETYWTLFNQASDVEVTSSGGYEDDSQSRYTYSKCLNPGQYNFTIYDMVGDGICCTWGMGNYSVSLDGIVKKRGSSFGDSDSILITVPVKKLIPDPSGMPSNLRTIHSSLSPSAYPIKSQMPSEYPSIMASSRPTNDPTQTPSEYPSSRPSRRPTNKPTFVPSSAPSTRPTLGPSPMPSLLPSEVPSPRPSSLPSSDPSLRPSLSPSSLPSGKPSTTAPSKALTTTAPSKAHTTTAPIKAPTTIARNVGTCGGSASYFELELLTDNFGMEVSWALINTLTDVKIASGRATDDGSPRRYLFAQCVDPGEYIFTIYDSGGDGICCAYGFGTYKVKLDGLVQKTGAEFDSVESTQVSVVAAPDINLVGPSTAFYIMGDTPYDEKDEIVLARQLRTEISTDGKFAVHVGDIQTAVGSTCTSIFADRHGRFLQSPIPMLMVPGDNDWIDCPNRTVGWNNWYSKFYKFEENWPAWSEFAPSMRRQQNRTENFAFSYNNILFIGLHLVGGRGYLVDALEWETRIDDCLAWSLEHFNAQKNDQDLRAIMILTHTRRKRVYRRFFTSIRDWVKEMYPADFPVYIVHGDGHEWRYVRPFSAAQNIVEVMVDSGGSAPPIKVTMNPRGHNEVLTFDRQGGLYKDQNNGQ